ncbi:glycosyltransferase family 4 protein [Sphingobacterium suaedae]|uniref:Glycosyltransferase family 4 protein n=1 Tax=Sphingobacterium suaedae TaxID=1686402 RepID=A0ABW5KHD6_9SPHI
MRIAIIATYPPRQCGIATFTHDFYRTLPADESSHGIIALSDGSEGSFPPEVCLTIHRNERLDYIEAAEYINTHFDVCVLQHEYGIFGGEAGDYILDTLSRLTIPTISNLHTVLQHPSSKEHEVLKRICAQSKGVTVMTDTAIQLLQRVFEVPAAKIQLIPHGVPNFDYNQLEAKKQLGFTDRKVMLTFGFLGRNKGIETAIEAVAKVQDPSLLYVVLGTTHPNVLREQGETYRELLEEQITASGLTDRVQLLNTFASEELLVTYLTACDIYVTPYPHENQISSGTLSFAIGAGAAVISTPYWYAKDLLANDRGLLFDFHDAFGLAEHINYLLDDPLALAKYRRNAASYGRLTSWNNVSKSYYDYLKQISVSMPTIELHKESKKVANLFLADRNRLSS